MIVLKQTNWFYIALIIFVVALPFSEALISISGVLLLLTSFLQIKKHTLANKLRNGKYLILFSSIYLVYLIGIIFCTDFKWGIYDLQKNIPFLIIPLAFLFGSPIEARKVVVLLKYFAGAVIGSALITLVTFYLNDERTVLQAQEFGFIHHIRFSFQLVLATIIISYFLVEKFFSYSWYVIVGLILFIAFLILFLLWHQSLTGLISFLGTAFVGLFLLGLQLKDKAWKYMIRGFLVALLLLPLSYLYYAVNRYYDIETVDLTQLDKETVKGNPYQHNFNNKQIENGHYVGLFWNEEEMKNAWNKRANLKYNERDKNGYQVKHTLVRYLSSKGLRKDEAGVSSLTETDIYNIEDGISNYILAQKGLSLYPRIYVSIWELDNYFKTGYANHQSLSQRIEYAKAALTIISDHFWFGVGSGNWKKAYREAYQTNKSQMDPARYGDAHNQYLNYMVKFGLFGLLWILFVIIFPVVKTGAYRNPIFFLFLISMLIANLGDSNLETHVGSSFFVLFYCLFISSEKLKSD